MFHEKFEVINPHSLRIYLTTLQIMTGIGDQV